MKHSKLLALIILVALQTVACKMDECEDATFEDQYLDPISLTFQSWEGVQSFIYKDSVGEEYAYSLSTSVEFLLNSINTGFCEDTSRTITFHTEYFLKRYSAINQTAIAYAQFVDFVEGEQDLSEENLTDKIGLSIFNDSIPTPVPITRIVLMTSPKNSSYSQSGYNHQRTIYHDSLTILGKVFYDLYEQRDGTPPMYYTKKEGVVSFADIQGTRLILDRVE